MFLQPRRCRVTSPQKAKGSAFERLTLQPFADAGYDVERTRVGWEDDRGDIHGITHPHAGNFTIECKNQKTMKLAEWLGELDREMKANSSEYGAVIHKRKGITDPYQQYATMPVSILVKLLRMAGFQ